MSQKKTNNDEPRGFIGMYTQRLEEKSRRLQEMEREKQLEKERELHKDDPVVVQVSEAAAAPKHRGILARIAEKEMQE